MADIGIPIFCTRNIPKEATKKKKEEYINGREFETSLVKTIKQQNIS